MFTNAKCNKILNLTKIFLHNNKETQKKSYKIVLVLSIEISSLFFMFYYLFLLVYFVKGFFPVR